MSQIGPVKFTLEWKGDAALQKFVIPAAEKAVIEAAKRGADIVAASFGVDHGGTPSTAWQTPHSQTNNLRRSIKYATPKMLGKPLTAAVGTNVPYGRILEFGGTIRAKGKKLAVPLNNEAKAMLRRAGGNLRSLNLRLIPRKGRPPLLVAAVGKGRMSRRTKTGGHAGGEQLRPLFVLANSVTISPRPFIRRLVWNPAHQATMYAEAARVFHAEMTKKGAA